MNASTEIKILNIDCSNYQALYQAPTLFDPLLFQEVSFHLEKFRIIQSDELTHIRCLIELAGMSGLRVNVFPPKDPNVTRYAEGMGLFKDFDIPGVVFANNKNTSYIPLTRINSDKNQFLEAEFLKIFDRLHLSATNVPFLCIAFTELADNIFYHSGPTDDTGWGYIHAQVFRDKIKITFTDTGVGFLNAYERSGTRKERNSVQLLTDSMTYLESRLNLAGQKPTRGIGLYEARELIENTGGLLTIRSVDGMIRISGKKPIQGVTTSWIFCGTQISMVVPI